MFLVHKEHPPSIRGVQTGTNVILTTVSWSWMVRRTMLKMPVNKKKLAHTLSQQYLKGHTNIVMTKLKATLKQTLDYKYNLILQTWYNLIT